MPNISNVTPAVAAPSDESSIATPQITATTAGRQEVFDDTLSLPQWNHNLMNLGAARQEGLTGAGISIGVLDTGFFTEHPDMTFAGGQSLFEDDAWTNDHTGHGTHVAGIIGAHASAPYPGVAPEASIYGIKVYHKEEVGEHGEPLTDVSNLASGIRLAADMGMNIILISSGVVANDSNLHDAVLYAQQAGALIVAAAGNGGALIQYPAAYPEVIAVSSVDANMNPAGDIIYGAENELAAPGVGITGLSTPDSPYGYPYVVMSGSSQAAPHVAGLAALLMQKFGTNADTIRDMLHEGAYDLGSRELYGYGLAGFLSEGVVASVESDDEANDPQKNNESEKEKKEEQNQSTNDHSLSNDRHVQKRVARALGEKEQDISTYEESKKENTTHTYITVVPQIIEGTAQFEDDAIAQVKEGGVLFIDMGGQEEQTMRLQLSKEQTTKIRSRGIALLLLHDTFEWRIPPDNLNASDYLIDYQLADTQNIPTKAAYAYQFKILEMGTEVTQFEQPFTFHFYFDDDTSDYRLYTKSDDMQWEESDAQLSENYWQLQTTSLASTFGLFAPFDESDAIPITSNNNLSSVTKNSAIPLRKVVIGAIILSGCLLFGFINYRRKNKKML